MSNKWWLSAPCTKQMLLQLAVEDVACASIFHVMTRHLLCTYCLMWQVVVQRHVEYFRCDTGLYFFSGNFSIDIHSSVCAEHGPFCRCLPSHADYQMINRYKMQTPPFFQPTWWGFMALDRDHHHHNTRTIFIIYHNVHSLPREGSIGLSPFPPPTIATRVRYKARAWAVIGLF